MARAAVLGRLTWHTSTVAGVRDETPRVRTILEFRGSIGKTDQVGGLMLFADTPRVVVRCTRCDNALFRAVRGGGRYWLDIRGAVCIEIDETRA